MNNEIVIGDRYTSLLKTDTKMSDVERECEYGEDIETIHKPIVRNRSVRTSDFFNKLQGILSTNKEILPAGCKFFSRVGTTNKILVIEETPKIRTIKVDMGMESVVEKLRKTGKLKEYGYENYLDEHPSSPYSFNLSFPYVVFIILLNERNEMCFMKPFFRLQPITSLSDHLFKAPLYNIPNSQDICLGGVQNFPSIYETVENIIETFWLNRYNYDYTNNIKDYELSEAFEVQDYLAWMWNTKINPMFIYGVDWVEYEYNIGQVIAHAEGKCGSMTSNSRRSFEKIHKALVTAVSDTETIDEFSKNITLNMRMDGETISIGDELIFEDKQFWLYSIVTKNDTGCSYDSVELEDSEGVIMSVPYDDFEDGFKTIFKPNFLDEAEIKGTVIKPGSIISCTIGDCVIYKKIKHLRNGIDGRIEALIDTDHYLIENIDFDVIDISNIKLEGQLLESDKTYYMVEKSESYCPTYYLKELTFDGININNSGTFIIKFRDPNHELETLNLAEYENGRMVKKFIHSNEICEEEVFNLFDRIFVNYNASTKLKIIKKKGILLNRRSRQIDYVPEPSDRSSLIDKILIEDGTRLNIPGVMVDIDFKVGDSIIYADWNNPDNMLYISTIDGFEVDLDANELFVCSTTLDKSHSFKIPFINLNRFIINIGVIRKVEATCGVWKSGDKIKANTTGITNFPKKDTNTIIGFINDGSTKYPLAFCSNLCTLWMKDDIISKFDVIAYNTVQWKKLENFPYDVDKLKWQHGDNMVRNGIATSNIYFLARRQGTQYGMEYHYVTTRGSIEWGSNITKNAIERGYTRHGFPMPRVSQANSDLRNAVGYPNMLGGFILDNNSRVYLKSEQLKEEF